LKAIEEINMTNHEQSTEAPKKTGKIIFWVVMIILAAVAAFFTFRVVKSMVASWEITNLPGLAIKPEEPTATPAPGEVPSVPDQQESAAPQPAGPTPEPWDGASRVNVLIMGLDYNDWREGSGPPLTDTMILFTIDPVAKTAGMISIPRDLWVSIPGYGYYKINQAYQLGEINKLPGGGPELATKTVEHLLGVPVQYYAQIDLEAFVHFIDEIGGVKVDVPKKIKIDLMDDEKGFIKLEKGTHTLPGEYALAYARARNTEGGDFDRAQRQQQIVFGIRNQILRFDLVPALIAKAPTLYNELSSGINSNLTFDEAFQLAWLATQIPLEEIQKGIIGPEQVNFGKSPDGLDVLKPLPDQIRLLRDEVFGITAESDSPVVASGKEKDELMADEGAKLALLNGTLTPGLAGRTEEYLTGLGANVTVVGDAENKGQPYTAIYDYTGNPYTLQYFVELMNISEYRIFFKYNPESEVDVTIILGDDWVGNNPMP
jgi:LCP family protein required for cell wall assembly